MKDLYKNYDWLYENYIVHGKSIRELCEITGVSHTTIETYLKKYDIRKTSKNPILPTKEELFTLHHTYGVGISGISRLYDGIGVDTVKRLMIEYEIEILDANALHKKWWSIPENVKVMSKKRKELWKNDEYAAKTSAHLTDRNEILKRSIMASARRQGVSIEDWNGFVTPDRTRARNTLEYKLWRSSVFERDNYTCQCCGARSKKGNVVKLRAHHLENFAQHKELRLVVSNGITLCSKCHDYHEYGSFHNIYGVRDNTKAQFEEYLQIAKDIKEVAI